ncbi:MAG: hypothetical protein CMK59_05810 [Proteobacteria bacterium]|nr:hypothetical protein [Pseudomonadota bacterium]
MIYSPISSSKKLRSNSFLTCFIKTIANIAFIFTMTFLLFYEEHLRLLIINTLSDAFWQVSVYVAASLTFYNFLDKKFFNNNGMFEQFPLLVSSFLGVLPGCGGAIVVITQFIQGHLSFGCVVAVLTATMGDAAFLLLANKFGDGIFVGIVCFVTALISGWTVEKIHHKEFMRVDYNPIEEPKIHIQSTFSSYLSNIQNFFWKWILIPSIGVSLLLSFQMDPNEILFLPPETIEYVGFTLAMLCLLIWNIAHIAKVFLKEKVTKQEHFNVGNSTNFVLFWVVISFLLFELTIYFTQFDLLAVFQEFFYLTPLLAILIGFLPGCGPQILVTTFYLSDGIPLSAQLGNAISNDGDALFPSIALAPKTALLATLYSAVPAVIVSYGYLLLFE